MKSLALLPTLRDAFDRRRAGDAISGSFTGERRSCQASAPRDPVGAERATGAALWSLNAAARSPIEGHMLILISEVAPMPFDHAGIRSRNKIAFF